MHSRKLKLFIACSLDGYIAGPNEDMSFLSRVESPGEDYGYSQFMTGIDTVLMGRKTFDWVYEQLNSVPHPNLDCYVISHQARPPIGKTRFYSEDPIALVRGLKAGSGKDILCDGGGTLIHSLLNAGLIDEFTLSLIPVLLGGGTPLFYPIAVQHSLKLLSSQQFPSGLQQLRYGLME